jgi:hypothetical protein
VVPGCGLARVRAKREATPSVTAPLLNVNHPGGREPRRTELTLWVAFPPNAPKRAVVADLPWMFAANLLSTADVELTKSTFQTQLNKLEDMGIELVAFELGNETNNPSFNGEFALYPNEPLQNPLANAEGLAQIRMVCYAQAARAGDLSLIVSPVRIRLGPPLWAYSSVDRADWQKCLWFGHNMPAHPLRWKPAPGPGQDRSVMSQSARHSIPITAPRCRRFQTGHGSVYLLASQRTRSALQPAYLHLHWHL